jgi:hypothetical protein
MSLGLTTEAIRESSSSLKGALTASIRVILSAMMRKAL